jgi:DNA-binding transcriptional LysR family regulator
LQVKTAADLWRGGRSAETLISLPSDEVMVRQFQTRLKQLGVNWRTRVEVSSIDLILTYVALGFGVGLSISVPRTKLPRGLRMLPLPGFPPLVVAVLSLKNLSNASATFLEELKHRARELEQQIL